MYKLTPDSTFLKQLMQIGKNKLNFCDGNFLKCILMRTTMIKRIDMAKKFKFHS